MIEKQSYQEPFSEVDKRKDDEMEIDLMAIFYKIITVRGVLCKAAGVGVIIAIVVALSIPKQYTVKVTLSPEMGNAKGSNGLAGLAASFLGDGVQPQFQNDCHGEHPKSANLTGMPQM